MAGCFIETNEATSERTTNESDYITITLKEQQVRVPIIKVGMNWLKIHVTKQRAFRIPNFSLARTYTYWSILNILNTSSNIKAALFFARNEA
jgi:hypothetical protein